MDVTLEERDGITLCALCKTSLGEDPAETCLGCKVIVHVACADELGGKTCSTPGCGGAWKGGTAASSSKADPVQGPPAWEQQPPWQPARPRPRGARALLWGALVALAAGSGIYIAAGDSSPPTRYGRPGSRRITDTDILRIEALGKKGGPEAARELAQDLHKGRKLRARALIALRGMGPDAAPAAQDVQRYLHDDDVWVGQMAREILQNTGEIALLQDEILKRLDGPGRHSAAGLCINSGAQGVHILGRALSSTNVETRFEAAKALTHPKVDPGPARTAIEAALTTEQNRDVRVLLQACLERMR